MRAPVALVVTLSVLALLPAVPTLAQTSNATPEDAIRAADAQWLSAVHARDLDKSVAACADDGSVLAPNALGATGKDAIRATFKNFFALPGFDVRWQPDKAGVAKSGELGYTSGTYQLTFNDPAGKPVTDKGKYVTVWKKQSDGDWKVFLDIFNSDLPLAP